MILILLKQIKYGVLGFFYIQKFFLKKKILIRGGYEPFKNSINNSNYLINFVFLINSLIAYLLANKIIVTTKKLKILSKLNFFL